MKLDPTVRTIFFVIAAFLTFLLVAYVTLQFRNGALVPGVVILVDGPLAVLASICWILGISNSARVVRVVGYAALGGISVGAVAFLAGFFGPLIFTPQSNQGPLLGIFVTGPLGFFVGVIGGAIYASRMPRPTPRTAPPNSP